LGEDVIMERLPFVRELATEYVGIDPVHEPIPVRPVVHYMMGGIHTDSYGKTPVDGLFAAGEGACVSMNGANRLGSNSLSEIIVFGARSGRAAAQYVEGRELPGADTLDQMAKEEKRRIEEKFLKPNNGNERIANIRRDMQMAMERGIGIYRTEEVMKETCEAIRALQQRFDQVQLDDLSSVFNTELIAALELGYMLDVAEALAHSALQREESRGSHAREDFETRDDERFLQHSMAYQTPEGPPRIEYLPVTITRWQPEERKY
ncbi:MAG: FAD-binding protein, partial [bacterium]|nr:FAD-binding protein [bacterium]